MYQQQTHLKCGLAACEGRRTKATPAGRLKQHKTVWKMKLIPPGLSRSPQMLSWSGTGQMPSRKVRLIFKPQQGQPLLGPERKLSVSSKQNLSNGLGAGHEDCHVLGPTEGSGSCVCWLPAQHVRGLQNTVRGNGDVLKGSFTSGRGGRASEGLSWERADNSSRCQHSRSLFIKS